MGTRDEPYITTSGDQGRNSRIYPSLTAEQLNTIQDNMTSDKHVPDGTTPQPVGLYDKPTVIELDRVDSATYGGAPFVFKGALKKPRVEIQRQKSRVGKIQHSVSTTVRTYSSIIKNFVIFLFLVLYTAYFIWALVYSIDGATALIVLTCLTVACIIYSYISNHYGETIYKHVLKPLGDLIDKHWPWAQW